MVVELYRTAGSPPSDAVQLIAKALGVELNVINVDLERGEHMKPEFLKMNPQHTVPTINDNGFYLAESRAIMIYLVETYGKDDSLYPKCQKKRSVVDQRLYFDIGTLYQRLIDLLFPLMLGEEKDIPEPKKTRFREALGMLNGFLADGYAAGNTITAADYSIVATVAACESVKADLSPYPQITSWLAKCKASMPGFKQIDTSYEFGDYFAPFFKDLGVSV